MILYGMFSGGVQYCSGTTKSGKTCRRRGYTTDRGYGFWCSHHVEQNPRRLR